MVRSFPLLCLPVAHPHTKTFSWLNGPSNFSYPVQSSAPTYSSFPSSRAAGAIVKTLSSEIRKGFAQGWCEKSPEAIMGCVTVILTETTRATTSATVLFYYASYLHT
ncbi:hypothetical protein Trydic_g16840 [Trypoxylus dichotomus]